MSSAESDESKSLLDIIEPWIPRELVNVLITHPAGVGLVMIVGGAFLKQTHGPKWGPDPNFIGPSRPGEIPMKIVGENPGLDLLVWEGYPMPQTTLGQATTDVSSIGIPWPFSLISHAVAGQVIKSAGVDPSTVLRGPLVQVYLSDIFIWAGAALFGGSAIASSGIGADIATAIKGLLK